jgi:hypothetical protein
VLPPAVPGNQDKEAVDGVAGTPHQASTHWPRRCWTWWSPSWGRISRCGRATSSARTPGRGGSRPDMRIPRTGRAGSIAMTRSLLSGLRWMTAPGRTGVCKLSLVRTCGAGSRYRPVDREANIFFAELHVIPEASRGHRLWLARGHPIAPNQYENA